MAESQHEHRLLLEKKVVESNTFSQKVGLLLGFVIAMTAIGGGIRLSLMGKGGAGLTSIISALAALVGVFIYGKIQQGKELTEKAMEIEQSIEPYPREDERQTSSEPVDQ